MGGVSLRSLLSPYIELSRYLTPSRNLLQG